MNESLSPTPSMFKVPCNSLWLISLSTPERSFSLVSSLCFLFLCVILAAVKSLLTSAFSLSTRSSETTINHLVVLSLFRATITNLGAALSACVVEYSLS